MKTLLNPDTFEEEISTVWSFPVRGNWATHNSKYRGNFAPQIARNIILKYSKENDLILDPMVGSGTSLIEAKLLNRNAIGVDINPSAVEITKKSLIFQINTHTFQKINIGNASSLPYLTNNSIDLIILHPPYFNIIQYSKGSIKEDISNISSINLFNDEIEKIGRELYRVLKNNRYCCVLIGDTRKAQHYVPLSSFLLKRFLKIGFILKEDIIKIQHNCSFSKRWEGNARKYGFHLIMHEHLFVFRKPKRNEILSKYKWSRFNESI